VWDVGEQVTWEEGLAKTVEWYKEFGWRYGDIEGALVAHPRAGSHKDDGI
jgi:UDP-glucose 4,6-dehydratase